MKSQLYDNHNNASPELSSHAPFSLIDAIGSRSRQELSPKKSPQKDLSDSKKFDFYQPDFSQSRSPKNPSMANKLRENRSVSNAIQAGLEDSLDKFQKERLRESKSPSHHDERYSPTVRNSPIKLVGSQGELSPGKREQGLSQSGLHLDLSSHKGSISSVVKMHSPKNSYIENEIVAHQKPLEKKFENPSTKIREYNIVTGEKTSPNTSILAGLPFGYVARSLERNLEDVHIKPILQYKKMDESPVHSPLKRQESYFTRKETMTYDKNIDNSGFVAGKNNFYGETEFRYANKPQPQEPLSPTQFYSAKALKNMSGFKLY